MKKIYVFTGYDKKSGKMTTMIRSDMDYIFDVIKYYSAETLAKRYKTVKDLEFDVASRRSHNGAVIIDDKAASWSIASFK